VPLFSATPNPRGGQLPLAKAAPIKPNHHHHHHHAQDQDHHEPLALATADAFQSAHLPAHSVDGHCGCAYYGNNVDIILRFIYYAHKLGYHFGGFVTQKSILLTAMVLTLIVGGFVIAPALSEVQAKPCNNFAGEGIGLHSCDPTPTPPPTPTPLPSSNFYTNTDGIITISTGYQTSLTENCNSGDEVVSGGYSLLESSVDNELEILASIPQGDTGWTIKVRNPSSIWSFDLVLSVRCAR